jgi:hypothetical protein
LERKEQEVKRRSFISGLLALIPVAAIPLPVFASATQAKSTYMLENYHKMLQVVEAFPKTPVSGSMDQLQRMHFVVIKRNPEHQMGITIAAQAVDPSNQFMLDKIFLEDDITTLEYSDTRPMINAIISGSNKVAVQTRRGKGNYYSIFSDHVLVWYQNSKSIFGPTYDAPVQMIGKNLAYNPNYKDYFVRVKCDNKLTDEHIQHLEKLGYTRV